MGTASLWRNTLPLDPDLGAHTTVIADVFQLLRGRGTVQASWRLLPVEEEGVTSIRIQRGF